MNDNAELLKQLRIERNQPEKKTPGPLQVVIPLAIAGVVLLSIAIAWWLLRGNGGPEVRTAQAAPLSSGPSAASVLDASGYVVARRMATVSAKVTGRVQEVLIEEGMRVEEGQVLARLDPVDADASRALATSQLAAARSQIDNVQAQLLEAEANATRLQKLVGNQLVSRAQYDQAVAQRDSLRAQLATVRRQAQVAQDQLRIAGHGVDNTVVRAPFSGVVIAKAAQPGEIVSPLATGGFTRTGIGTIVDMDSLEVEVDVGEAYIGRVRAKMPVEATLNAYPDWKIPAEVIATIPTADRGKATVKVRIALKEKDPRIVPDMGVTVSFLEQAPENDDEPRTGVRVPAEALVERDGQALVFVLGDDDRVSERQVQATASTGSTRDITSGLAPGELVVLDPPEELADGDRVKPAGSN
ncbi:efflux transporter, RND family, MFP subunit [Pseudoxanthomonas suwonensis 11-1]|uniref:Efflux transporter, RND family, MFP subunit n=1 Tax=Pseudoxanthomonas suwonensis (strain 11-1) TaxID=743721 RepID=E6WWI3_PSEUU|nr:efflux RND transporter periplasmic adaptor subunit [Pseudoxanthomonas suwonensis]ADV28460.1 efflux transporter, RND family, MFP subunit [Pseudoxanthomonas suwonensis 11-1]